MHSREKGRRFVLTLEGRDAPRVAVLIALCGLALFVSGLMVGATWPLPSSADRAAGRIAVAPPQAPPGPELADLVVLHDLPGWWSRPLGLPDQGSVRVHLEPPAPSSLVADLGELTTRHFRLTGVHTPALSRPLLAPERNRVDPAAEPVEADPEPLRAYTIQVGAFQGQANAQRLARRLQAKGYDVYIRPVLDARSRPWYLVRLGNFQDRDRAWNQAAQLQGLEELRLVVRPAGSF